MSNKVIHDMIEAIEHFAQVQPDFPVYDILGQVHTYGDLKKDSDSLAAQIDRLGLPDKSPVVVFGGQEYEMLATFVALTKSGHAYIPIDSHSALERVAAIVEVAEPSLIIAINDFPLADVTAPISVRSKFRQPSEREHPMSLAIRCRKMTTITSFSHRERLASLRECRFPTIICSALRIG